MRLRTFAWPTTLGCLVACGASTGLLVGEPRDAGSEPDVGVGIDAGVDAVPSFEAGFDALAEVGLDASPEAGLDAPSGIDAPVEATPETGPSLEAGQCDEGLNTQYPTTDCSGDTTDWFASPYTPGANILVNEIQLHTVYSNVAVLTSLHGAPGTVLFKGTVGTPNAAPHWQGTTVNPPLSLQGGRPYYLAFQDMGSYCSMASGPEAVEYIAPSLSGPWMIDGSDIWTARLIGTCSLPP